MGLGALCQRGPLPSDTRGVGAGLDELPRTRGRESKTQAQPNWFKRFQPWEIPPS